MFSSRNGAYRKLFVVYHCIINTLLPLPCRSDSLYAPFLDLTSFRSGAFLYCVNNMTCLRCMKGLKASSGVSLVMVGPKCHDLSEMYEKSERCKMLHGCPLGCPKKRNFLRI